MVKSILNKHKAAYVSGKVLERKIANLCSKVTEHYHLNLILPRPEKYRNVEGHTKKFIELDVVFYSKGILYIVQCKRRRGVSKKGKRSNFWLPNYESKDIYFNGKKATGWVCDNLWKARQYIKNHKIYKFHGYPKIQLVICVDSVLKVGDKTVPIAKVRGIPIIIYDYFSIFYKKSKIKNTPTESPETYLIKKRRLGKFKNGEKVYSRQTTPISDGKIESKKTTPV